jgi:hypothetical protein
MRVGCFWSALLAAPGLDDSSTFITQHDDPSGARSKHSRRYAQVAVAPPGSHGPHENLAAEWCSDVDGLDCQRFVLLSEDGSLHLHGGSLSI